MIPAGIIDDPDNSLFSYEEDKSWADYFDPNFTPAYQPTFTDPALEEKAMEICGDDQFCVFDIAATEREEVGMSTMQGNLDLEMITQLSQPGLCVCMYKRTCGCVQMCVHNVCLLEFIHVHVCAYVHVHVCVCIYADASPSTAEVAVCYDRLTHLPLSPLEPIFVRMGQQSLKAQPSVKCTNCRSTCKSCVCVCTCVCFVYVCVKMYLHAGACMTDSVTQLFWIIVLRSDKCFVVYPTQLSAAHSVPMVLVSVWPTTHAAVLLATLGTHALSKVHIIL